MAKIVFLSKYIRGSAHLGNNTRYVATRDGVQLLEDMSESSEQLERFVDYISLRPGVKKQGAHGLFDANGKVKSLANAVNELSNYPGIVWTPVISLPRKEAERLGFDRAENWQQVIKSCLPEIAEGYKIPLDNLRWYAALHEKEKHIHVHMIVFSSNPSKGYLTRQGIEKVKSAFARSIYSNDLIPIYREQTERRHQLQGDAEGKMLSLINKMEQGEVTNPKLEQLILELYNALESIKGKKVYGYLKPELKKTVDQIVDELAKDERVAEAYSLWYDLRETVINTYTDNLPERVPLSQQAELKAVRNMVIREVIKMNPEFNEVIAEKELPIYITHDLPKPPTGTEFAPAPKEENAPKREPMAPELAHCAAQMFHHMGRIFREQTGTDSVSAGLRLDKKRRKQLQEKRIALGHKPDDHEDYVIKM